MPATLARLLVEGGVINRTLADECLRRHLQVGGALDTVVLEASACPENLLLGYLAQASEFPAAFGPEFANPDRKIIQVFPFKLADRHGMVPIAMAKRHLEVAAAYPLEKLLLEELSFMLGRDLRPRVCIEARVRAGIALLYDKPLAPRFASLVRRLGPPPTSVPDLVDARARPAPPRQSNMVMGKAGSVGEIAVWPPPAARPPAPPPPPPNRVAARPAPAPLDPVLAPEPLPPAPLLEEEDAAALLGEELPPEPAGIVLDVAPPVALEIAPPEPAVEGPLLDAPLEIGAAGEEDVRVDDDIVDGPIAPPVATPLPARTEPSDARPQSRGLAEAQQMMAGWRPSSEMTRLEDALADALEGIRPSEPEPEPVDPRSLAPARPAPVEPPPPARVEPPPELPRAQLGWTLSEARAHLAAAPTRDTIIEVALRFALKSFDFAAALAIRSGTAFGWAGLTPDGAWHDEVHQLSLPLDSPSVLRTVLRARGRYLGPLPEDELTDRLLRDMARERPMVALLYPVFVRERPVAIFYADRGRRHVAAPRVAEFLLFAQELATALERAIILGKRRSFRAVAEAPMLPAPIAEGSPLEDDALFPINEEAPSFEHPTRTVAAMLADLLGPDRRARLAAMAELETVPEQAAPALAAQFPGPTALRRGLVIDLPDPEELGPVLGALARLGRTAVPYVDQLLREGDPDQRFFAVLLAGAMKQAAFFPAVARTLFDPVPEVATAARAAAGTLRILPGFEEAVARPLRAELSSTDIDRVASAALAIGRTRDVQAIPPLIPLTGHADDRVAAEASDALTQITKQTHGDSPRRWLGWWDQNRNRPRVAWLVEGLAHKDLQVRLSSIEELVEITSDAFGYLADGGRRERETALEQWDAWLQQQLR